MNFTPDGQTTEKTKQSEYNKDQTIGKIVSMDFVVVCVKEGVEVTKLGRLKITQGRKREVIIRNYY